MDNRTAFGHYAEPVASTIGRFENILISGVHD